MSDPGKSADKAHIKEVKEKEKELKEKEFTKAGSPKRRLGGVVTRVDEISGAAYDGGKSLEWNGVQGELSPCGELESHGEANRNDAVLRKGRFVDSAVRRLQQAIERGLKSKDERFCIRY